VSTPPNGGSSVMHYWGGGVHKIMGVHGPPQGVCRKHLAQVENTLTLLTVRPARQDAVYLRRMTTTALRGLINVIELSQLLIMILKLLRAHCMGVLQCTLHGVYLSLCVRYETPSNVYLLFKRTRSVKSFIRKRW